MSCININSIFSMISVATMNQTINNRPCIAWALDKYYANDVSLHGEAVIFTWGRYTCMYTVMHDSPVSNFVCVIHSLTKDELFVCEGYSTGIVSLPTW